MILEGQPLYPEPIQAKGILFIGDPHISSNRPGRRKDASWPAPILAKLERCVEVANERELVPVFAGDIFDEPIERNEALKTRIARLMKRFWMLPITNVGNHDISGSRLSDADSLAYLAVCDGIDAVAVSGAVCVIDVDGRKVGLGMTPYGQEIPRSVEGAFDGIAKGVDSVIWVTHHDIAFQENYPGAVKPFPIVGCDVVLNGHVHNLKTAERVGKTTWRNLGNINRKSADLIDQEPQAWAIAWDGAATGIALPHDKDVFDMTGRLVQAASAPAVVKVEESVFVTLLHAESAGQMAQSADGSVLMEEIDAKCERDKTSPAVRAIVLALLREATGARAPQGEAEEAAGVDS